MEFFGILLVLLFLVLVIGSILGFVAMSRIGELDREMKKLRAAVNTLQNGRSDTSSVSEFVKPPIPLPEKIKPTAPEVPKPKPITSESSFAKPTPPIAVAATAHTPEIKTPQPAKPEPTRKWEEEFGARWTVWVGGIALAFGAVFLLRYAAEAGIFTPAMRLGLAAIMGFVALVVGEVLRQSDPTDAKLPEMARATIDNAYIPGVLTAVGIFTLLGSVYAAYGIYGFFGPSLAFILLGLISLGGIALGLLHGPKLSALGLLAALVTPLLVHTGTPQYTVLFTYLLIIGGATIALGQTRKWYGLTLGVIGGLLIWAVITVQSVSGSDFTSWAVYMGLIYVTGLTLFRRSNNHEDETTRLGAQVLTLSVSSIIAAIILLSAILNNFEMAQFSFAMGAAIVFMLIGWRVKSLDLKILLGGALAGILLYGLASTKSDIVTLLIWATPTMILFLGLGTLGLRDKSMTPKNAHWTIWVPAIPFLTFASWPFANLLLSDSVTGGIMAVLTLTFVGLTFYHDLAKRIWSVHTHVIASALSYVLATALYFTGLPVSLALITGIILTALLSLRIKSDSLPYIALGFGGLVAAHVLFLEVPTPGRISPQIILNQLWIYLALPAVLCAGTGIWFGRKGRSLGTEGLKALGLAFAALFAVFQIRHLMNGGDLFAYSLKFDELALHVLIGLSFTLGGTLISQKGPREKLAAHDLLIPNLAMLISGLTLAMFVLGVCLVENPLFTDASDIRGNVLINSLTLAYLLPAILLAGIAWLSQSRRPPIYVRLAAGLSLVSFLLYLTAQIRFIFTGADISFRTSFPDGLELYMISAVWLALGVVLLFAGLKTKRRDLRLASAIVIILTVLKAFLIDMAGLEGVLRAMAFVVLGIILIVVGRVYQKLLFSGEEDNQ